MPLRQLPSGDPSSELIESLPSPTSVVSAESPSVVSAESEGLPPPVIAAAAANVFVGSASPAAIAAASARAFGSCGASRGSSGTARVQVPGCYMELQAATMCYRLLQPGTGCYQLWQAAALMWIRFVPQVFLRVQPIFCLRVHHHSCLQAFCLPWRQYSLPAVGPRAHHHSFLPAFCLPRQFLARMSLLSRCQPLPFQVFG